MSSHAKVLFDLLRPSGERRLTLGICCTPVNAIRLPHHSATFANRAALYCSVGRKSRFRGRLGSVCATNNYLEMRAKPGIYTQTTLASHRAIGEAAGSRHDRLITTD
jgi:hypothetical protein